MQPRYIMIFILGLTIVAGIGYQNKEKKIPDQTQALPDQADPSKPNLQTETKKTDPTQKKSAISNHQNHSMVSPSNHPSNPPGWLNDLKIQEVSYDQYLLLSHYLNQEDIWSDDFKEHLINGFEHEPFYPVIAEALTKCNKQECLAITQHILDKASQDPYRESMILSLSTEDQIHQSLQKKMSDLCASWMASDDQTENLSPACFGLARWSHGNHLDDELLKQTEQAFKQGMSQEKDLTKKLVAISATSFLMSKDLKTNLIHQLDHPNELVSSQAAIAISFDKETNMKDLLDLVIQKTDGPSTIKLLTSLQERKASIDWMNLTDMKNLWEKLPETESKIIFIEWMGAFFKRNETATDFLLGLGKKEKSSKIILVLGKYLEAKDFIR